MTVCALTTFAFLTFAASAAPGKRADFSGLDAIITDQMEKHGLPGAVIAIIEADEIVFLQGYGVAGRERPMTPQTRMFIGSQSKSFTALAVAQLADNGNLDLGAPVQTLYPLVPGGRCTSLGQNYDQAFTPAHQRPV